MNGSLILTVGYTEGNVSPAVDKGMIDFSMEAAPLGGVSQLSHTWAGHSHHTVLPAGDK